MQFAAAVAAGADGYLPKTAPFEELLAAVRTVAAGRSLLSPDARQELVRGLGAAVAASIAARRRLARLTPAERRVLDLLAAGWTVREIAAELVVAVSTVRAHIRGLHTKLEVSSQLAAVAVLRVAG